MGLGGSSLTVDPGRYAREVFGYGNLSPWGPLPSEGILVCAGGGAGIPGTLMNEGGL